MGGKKKMVLMAGSLKRHWMENLQEIHIRPNRGHDHGMKMGRILMSEIKGVNPAFIKPGFNHSYVELNKSYKDPSYVKLHFLTGY